MPYKHIRLPYQAGEKLDDATMLIAKAIARLKQVNSGTPLSIMEVKDISKDSVIDLLEAVMKLKEISVQEKPQ